MERRQPSRSSNGSQQSEGSADSGFKRPCAKRRGGKEQPSPVILEVRHLSSGVNMSQNVPAAVDVRPRYSSADSVASFEESHRDTFEQVMERHQPSRSSNGSQQSEGSTGSDFKRPCGKRRSGKEQPCPVKLELGPLSTGANMSQNFPAAVDISPRFSSAASFEKRSESHSLSAEVDTDPSKCPCCQSWEYKSQHNSFRFVLDFDQYGPGSVRDRVQKSLHGFFMTVNALMNDCGGFVCLHFCQPRPLVLLDDIVDQRLASLIANDTSFEDNFERHVRDYRHVVYRVKPTDYPCVSTFSFNSPVALNRQLVEPTQGQIRRIMQNIQIRGSMGSDDDCDEHGPASSIRLNYNEPVDLRASCEVYLAEIDAEAVDATASGEGYGEKLADHCWERLKLPEYIAAYCKHRRGGSVYLGIVEERLPPTKAWIPVESLELGKVLETKLKIWQDREPSEKRRVFYLAEDKDVPDFRGPSEIKVCGPTSADVGPKTFGEPERHVCRGVSLPANDRKSFHATLLRRAKEDLFWYPQYPPEHPIRTYCYSLEGGPPNLCVVEVRVVNFHGVAFLDKHGPRAYKVNIFRELSAVSPIPMDEYVKIQQIRDSSSSMHLASCLSSRV